MDKTKKLPFHGLNPNKNLPVDFENGFNGLSDAITSLGKSIEEAALILASEDYAKTIAEEKLSEIKLEKEKKAKHESLKLEKEKKLKDEAKELKEKILSDHDLSNKINDDPVLSQFNFLENENTHPGWYKLILNGEFETIKNIILVLTKNPMFAALMSHNPENGYETINPNVLKVMGNPNSTPADAIKAMCEDGLEDSAELMMPFLMFQKDSGKDILNTPRKDIPDALRK